MKPQIHLNRYSPQPDVPEWCEYLPVVYQTHLDTLPDGDTPFDRIFKSPYHEGKGTYPCYPSAIREWAATFTHRGHTRAMLNCEMGPLRLSTTSRDRRCASALAHYGRIVEEWRRWGVEIFCHYNMAWWNYAHCGADALIHHDLISGDSAMITHMTYKVPARLRVAVKIDRHRYRADSWHWYRQDTNTSGLVLVDPNAAEDMDDWRVTVRAQRVLCEQTDEPGECVPGLWADEGPPPREAMPDDVRERYDYWCEQMRGWV